MEKVFEWLITGIIGFTSSFVIYKIAADKKYKKELNDQISKKADQVYVDKKIDNMSIEFDKKLTDKNTAIKEIVTMHIENDNKRWDQLFMHIEGIKTQQDMIIKKLIK